MKIIDAHCDLLDKMSMHPELSFKQDSVYADVSFPRLNKSGVAVQCFAVFISNKKKVGFEQLLESFDLFHTRIACHEGVYPVQSRGDLQRAESAGKLGAILTLEGVEGLEGSLVYLRTAFRLGVRLLGLTWNYANWAADGVLEKRNGGFTIKGRGLVEECNRLGIILDVSHLSEAGFWELAELSTKPFVATHSNAQHICPHPRNLNDSQIEAIVRSNGIIGLTFVPWFVKASEPSIKDILNHIDHIGSLGGNRHIGFGSDFDGIDYHIPGLEHAGNFDRLANELHKRYGAREAESYLYGNWRRFLGENLPE
jgi:membrane dipeptidase